MWSMGSMGSMWSTHSRDSRQVSVSLADQQIMDQDSIVTSKLGLHGDGTDVDLGNYKLPLYIGKKLKKIIKNRDEQQSNNKTNAKTKESYDC